MCVSMSLVGGSRKGRSVRPDRLRPFYKHSDSMGFWGVVAACLASFLSCLLAQDCAVLTSHYAATNYRNISQAMSNVPEFRDLALRPLLAQPRVSGTQGNALARTHIATWLQAEGWTVTQDAFVGTTPYGPVAFSNVVATLGLGKARRVVLACHYDTKLTSGVRFLGAIDSAVPCALLMDAALRLKDLFAASRNSSSDLTIQLIFFDGEEAFWYWSRQDSLYGARHLASQWEATRDATGRNYLQSIETFILLDLIGTSDTHFKLRFPETETVYNKLLNIETCLRQQGLLNDHSQSGHRIFTSARDFFLIEDDHLPFYNKGVPVVHLITYPFPAVWHTASDDINALDFTRIDDLARILRVFLADLPL